MCDCWDFIMVSSSHHEWHLTYDLNGIRVQVSIFIRPLSEESTACDKFQQALWERLFLFSSWWIRVLLLDLKSTLRCKTSKNQLFWEDSSLWYCTNKRSNTLCSMCLARRRRSMYHWAAGRQQRADLRSRSNLWRIEDTLWRNATSAVCPWVPPTWS